MCLPAEFTTSSTMPLTVFAERIWPRHSLYSVDFSASLTYNVSVLNIIHSSYWSSKLRDTQRKLNIISLCIEINLTGRKMKYYMDINKISLVYLTLYFQLENKTNQNTNKILAQFCLVVAVTVEQIFTSTACRLLFIAGKNA